MKEIILNRDTRLALRSLAHHLDPVVLLGANGLTDAVIREIDRALTAHELIKVRVPTDDREERETIFAEVAEKLGAARVQMIGKLLIFWRPTGDKTLEEQQEAARLAVLTSDKASVAGKRVSPQAKTTTKKAVVSKPAKKVASKKPGEKKKRVEAAPRRARPKRHRVTKKAAMA
jgi:RNA-binding protein